MHRLILLPVAFALLAGCQEQDGQEAIRNCEEYVQGKLRSPSTFKAVKTNYFLEKDTATVFLHYDAANAYGTPIRELQRCQYPLDAKGRPDLTMVIDHDAELRTDPSLDPDQMMDGSEP